MSIESIVTYFEQFVNDPLTLLVKTYELGSYMYKFKYNEIYDSNKENIESVKRVLSEKITQYKFPEHLLNRDEHLSRLPIKLINYYHDCDRQAHDLYKIVNLEKHFSFRNEVEQIVNREFNTDWWSEIDNKYDKITDGIGRVMSKYEEDPAFVMVNEIVEKIKDETIEMLEFLNKNHVSDEELRHIFNGVCDSNKVYDMEQKDKIFKITKGMISVLYNLAIEFDNVSELITKLTELSKQSKSTGQSE